MSNEQVTSGVDFFAEDISPPELPEKKIAQWLISTAISEGAHSANLTIVFCSDEYLLEMNREHLGHDYYTDIITFPFGDPPNIVGDLFISIDRVKENASDLNLPGGEELRRVMVHGLLHLLGYTDLTGGEKQKMREMENQYLKQWETKFGG
ncbi:MAG: rRNA maturation RNase YbeY [Saprospirales bacterium]|nr:MAG: rRNA maturation RNase YbeY [Saprospirales bacterium]